MERNSNGEMLGLRFMTLEWNSNLVVNLVVVRFEFDNFGTTPGEFEICMNQKFW